MCGPCREKNQEITGIWEADLFTPQPGSKGPFNLEMNAERRGCTGTATQGNILLKHPFFFFFICFLVCRVLGLKRFSLLYF